MPRIVSIQKRDWKEPVIPAILRRGVKALASSEPRPYLLSFFRHSYLIARMEELLHFGRPSTSSHVVHENQVFFRNGSDGKRHGVIDSIRMQ